MFSPYPSIVSRNCTVNLLKPTGHVMHQQFNIQQLYVLPTLYLCVLYLSENKQRDLCHLQYKLIGFYNRDEKCLLRDADWVFIYNSTFCPHSVFKCFVWVWEQTAIVSLYSINWLVCITETECVYCAVRTGSLYIILRSAHTVYVCVLCGSENKQRLFTYTALTDWFV